MWLLFEGGVYSKKDSMCVHRLPGYPSGDEAADAARMNAAIEAEIRRHPEQYLWLHRRFKTHPQGKAVYGSAQRRRKRRKRHAHPAP